MNKKIDLEQHFKNAGYDRVQLKWIPKNPYGRQHKLNGWIYKLDGDLEWSKLGNNFDEAVKNISLL
tara:strand:- start:1151 stop:1348 length:198 start_codon:yes stop_codon:yes gene_type:complete